MWSLGVRVRALWFLFLFPGGMLWGSQVEMSWKTSKSGSTFTQDAALFLLQAVSSRPVLVKRELVSVAEDDFAAEAWKVLKNAKSSADVLSLFKNKTHQSLLGKVYADRSRERFHLKAAIPDTLPEFESLYGFRDKGSKWRKTVVERSAVKGLQRHLYRAPASVGEISVAQTIQVSQTGNTVRETEVIAARDGEDDWDFYVYDEKGEISVSSTFALKGGKDLVAPVPLTCLTCHYDVTTRSFTNTSFVRPTN